MLSCILFNARFYFIVDTLWFAEADQGPQTHVQMHTDLGLTHTHTVLLLMVSVSVSRDAFSAFFSLALNANAK